MFFSLPGCFIFVNLVCRYFLRRKFEVSVLGWHRWDAGWIDGSRLYARWDDSIIYVAGSGWNGLDS